MPYILVATTASTARLARDRTLFRSPESALQASEDPPGLLSRGSSRATGSTPSSSPVAEKGALCQRVRVEFTCHVSAQAHVFSGPSAGRGRYGPAWAQEDTGKATPGRGSHTRVPHCALAQPPARWPRGPGARLCSRAVSRSQGQAHTLAQTKPGRPPRWSPTKAGSAAHRQRSSQAGTTAAPSRCGFAGVRACSLLYSDGGGRRKSRTHRAPPREVASEEAARPPGLTAPCEVLFLWETGRLEAFSLTWEARLTFSEIPPQEKQKCSVPEAEFT